MLTINIANVEELVFYDANIHKLFPEFSQMFKLWKSGVVFGIKSLSKQILLDFLNSINNTHIEILKNYFKMDVRVDNIDYHLVKDFKVPISDADCAICGLKGYRNFTTYRDDNYLYICFWR
jgi:hypothetical protein